MPGLKRQASKEKPEPHEAKRIRTDYSIILPPARSPWANTLSAVFVWGCGDDGSLGLGPDYLDEVPRPRQLCGDEIMSIAAGGMYTLLLGKNGKVGSCGNNDKGSLGRETESAKYNLDATGVSFDEIVSTPHLVPDLGSRKISSISAGNELSAATTTTGELFIWGAVRDSKGPITLPNGQRYFHLPITPFDPTSNTKVSSVVCGENHILVVSITGALYAWGINEYCQLGIVSPEANVLRSPIRIDLPFSRRVVRAAAGGMHSFAIDIYDDVWTWGLNSRGQTGIDIDEDGHRMVIETPRRVPTMCEGNPALAGSHVVDIACGEFHSVFLLQDGRVFTCGAYDSGQLGLGPVNTLVSVNKVHHPRIRTGIAVPLEVHFPFPSGGVERIIGIEADSRRSMAWTKSHLYVWGMGNVGELGLGPVTEVFQPTLIDLVGWKPIQVSCGGQHTLALFTED